MQNRYFIVDKKVLPEVFSKVIKVKKLMAQDNTKTVQEAAACVISRSAFYKYRDYVFELGENSTERTVTLGANLSDKSGILSDVLNVIAEKCANILTINQTIPINGVANVTITIEIGIDTKIDSVLDELSKINGVYSLKILAREWN